MKRLIPWLLSFLVGLNFQGSLTAQGDKKEYKTPQSPRDALLMAAEGLVDGNQDQLNAVMALVEKETDLLKAQLKFIAAAKSFKEAFIKAYGEPAWVRFNDKDVDPGNGEGNATLALATKQEALDAVKAAKIEEKEKEALATVEQKGGRKMVWKLTKSENGWKVTGATFHEGGLDLDRTIKNLNALADLVAKYQRAIGKDKITADDIDVELGKAFIKETTMGLVTKPPRFDVAKYQP